MISLNGFNGFRQLYCLQSIISEDGQGNRRKNIDGFKSIHEITINKSFINDFTFPCQTNLFSFSWSFCLLYHGDILWLCGFLNKKDGSVQKLKSPNNKSILQASCNRRYVVCVMEGGCCWQYSLESQQWKDLTGILCTEQRDESIAEQTVVKVCCGETVTAALTSCGEVYNIPNKFNLPGIKIVDIACGRSHILLLSDRGEIYTAGEGSRGQLGHGELENEEEPCLVEGLAGLNVLAVACGAWHSCALTSDGDLYSWGWNVCGQLGLHTEGQNSKVSVQAVPQVVYWPGEAEVKVIKVACGARHTVALLDDGSVWGCGWNGYRQLALPRVETVSCMTKLPTQLENIKYILCGPWNTCLIT